MFSFPGSLQAVAFRKSRLLLVARIKLLFSIIILEAECSMSPRGVEPLSAPRQGAILTDGLWARNLFKNKTFKNFTIADYLLPIMSSTSMNAGSSSSKMTFSAPQ